MNKYLVQPKFSVGDKVVHKSNPDTIMIISSENFETKSRPTAFGSGIPATSKNSYFDGHFICEWMKENKLLKQQIHQDMLKIAP